VSASSSACSRYIQGVREAIMFPDNTGRHRRTSA
jgi:hypothetical protein